MEDAVSIRPDFLRGAADPSSGKHHFYGVFDGHGCCHVRAPTSYIYIIKRRAIQRMRVK
jgi:serine/threonine protein phosphatase PrpC